MGSCIASIVSNRPSPTQIPVTWVLGGAGRSYEALRPRRRAQPAARIGPMPLRLTKYQALGNDYLVLDLPAPLARIVPLLPNLCDRHLGPGSDGLLAFDPTTVSIRIFNPD